MDFLPEVTIAASSVSVMSNQGDVILSVGEWSDGTMRTTKITVPANDVAQLMTSVAQSGGQALSYVAEAWRRGDCPTCHNVRLVDTVTASGRKSNDYCKDCARPGSTYAGYPRVWPRTPAQPPTTDESDGA